MPNLVKRPPYQVGDQVQVKFGARLVGTVTEARGTYSPRGHPFYRVGVSMDPEPLWLELGEDEIEKA